MKSIILWAAVFAFAACQEKLEPKNVRDQKGLSQGADARAGDPEPAVGDDEVQFPALELKNPKNLSQLTAEQLESFRLVSLTEGGQSLLFIKDGLTWSYGGDEAPRVMEAAINQPETRQLYLVGEEDFWLVDADRVSKRQGSAEGESDSGQIILFNYDLSQIQGERESFRVLYAGEDLMVLSFLTHLAILTVEEGKAVTRSLEIRLPVESRGGQLVAAGLTVQGNLWLASSEGRFVTLSPAEGGWLWSPINLSIATDIGALQSVSMVIHEEKGSVEGEVLVLGSNGLFSRSGDLIAADAPEEEAPQ